MRTIPVLHSILSYFPRHYSGCTIGRSFIIIGPRAGDGMIVANSRRNVLRLAARSYYICQQGTRRIAVAFPDPYRKPHGQLVRNVTATHVSAYTRVRLPSRSRPAITFLNPLSLQQRQWPR